MLTEHAVLCTALGGLVWWGSPPHGKKGVLISFHPALKVTAMPAPSQQHTWLWPECGSLVSPQSRTVLSLKQEGNPEACSNMDELWRRRAKRNNQDTKRQTLYDSTPMRLLTVSSSETEVEVWLPGAGVVVGESAFNGDRVSISGNKSSGDGWQPCLHNDVNIFNDTRLYI